MTTQIAEVELGHAPAVTIAVPAFRRPCEDEVVELERPLGAARGIARAVLIAVPLWALFGFALYLLI